MNIIGENRKGNPLLTRTYSRAILHDYMASRGLKAVNLESMFTINDIENFIKERRMISDKYARVLDGLSLDYREADTIENIDSKEFLITRTCDYDTTILSSDKKITQVVRPDRVLFGNIQVFHGVPTIANKMGSGYNYKIIDNSHFKTIMKTNPKIAAIKYYEKLKQVSGFNMIIGVNGSIYDRDKQDKIDAMNYLSDRLDNSYLRFQYEDEDDYMCILASRDLKRIK